MNDMSAKQPKLMTRGKFTLVLALLLVGASLQPVREYLATGTISTVTAIAAAIAFCVGLAMLLVMGWWANRPERGGTNE